MLVSPASPNVYLKKKSVTINHNFEIPPKYRELGRFSGIKSPAWDFTVFGKFNEMHQFLLLRPFLVTGCGLFQPNQFFEHFSNMAATVLFPKLASALHVSTVGNPPYGTTCSWSRDALCAMGQLHSCTVMVVLYWWQEFTLAACFVAWEAVFR